MCGLERAVDAARVAVRDAQAVVVRVVRRVRRVEAAAVATAHCCCVVMMMMMMMIGGVVGVIVAAAVVQTREVDLVRALDAVAAQRAAQTSAIRRRLQRQRHVAD